MPAPQVQIFSDDLAFLRRHTNILVLSDVTGASHVALAPDWQGRVMTSTAGDEAGLSFGWINRELIASGELRPHMNAFGGEDRVWLGPEGGQFSIYFAPGTSFDFEHWFVPAALDTLPFEVVNQARDRAGFQARFELVNRAGTEFRVALKREVLLLDKDSACRELDLQPSKSLAVVAYESKNTLINAGKQPWKKDTGLLSLWILGMFNPSPSATIVIPLKQGPQSELGPQVTSDYFGAVPPERLQVKNNTIFFRGDGRFRSKIGVNPRRSLGKFASYDAVHRVLTLVRFTQPQGLHDYVNSLWKLQDDPYSGDAINSYNDGPTSPGAKPMGPFFELESSSPAAALAPAQSLEHRHRTIHLTGPEHEIDAIARTVLGLSLSEIKVALPNGVPDGVR